MKQLPTTLAIIAMSTTLLISCSDTDSESGTNTATSGETKSDFDLAAARKTIDSTNAVFAGLVSKGDSSGVATMYTADAKLMGANMPTASGRPAIKTAFAGMFSAMGPIDLKTTAVDLWGDEDMLIEEGTYAMSQKGKEIDRGKYIVLWKMEDGKWKLFRDCFNSDLPLAPPAK